MSLLKHLGLNLLGCAAGLSIVVAVQNYDEVKDHKKNKIESVSYDKRHDRLKDNFHLSLSIPVLNISGTLVYLASRREDEY